MQRNYKSIQVFQNPFLERLTHVHPVTPFVLWGPVALLLIWRSLFVYELSVVSVLSIGVGAFFFWTLSEYLLHRFPFHYQGESAWSKRLHFLIHGLHHDDPNDPTRLVMPPSASIILAAILFPLFRMVLGPIWVEPFFAFFLIGYLCYDYTHYAVHHFRPTTRFGKMLKHHHMQHHFATPNSRWGVSSPLWDAVFGTLEEPASAQIKSKKSAL